VARLTRRHRTFGAGALAVTVSLAGTLAARAQAPSPAAATGLSAEDDHRRLLDLLHIKELRPGADGRNPQAPNAANYDEARANPFPRLPDPLVSKSGRPVTTADAWWKQRRPEIVEDFDREIYGRVPRTVPSVRWQVLTVEQGRNGASATMTRRLVGHAEAAGAPAIAVDIDMTLVTPAAAKGRVPVIVQFTFPGTFPGLPPEPTPTWQQQLLAKGWGYAILLPTTVQADNGAGLAQGIIGLANRGRPRALDDWGALRAWAWGASRALDYLETDAAVDAKRVGIAGLSRYGKAALVTMAYDQRFAVGLIGSSGEGGAKLHRRNFGELVENLAGSGEYHWMAGNFLKYAGPLTAADLPVDAHELIALCAPRPVFVSCGSPTVEGQWVDARGMFMATVAAGPVYRLLGRRDLGTAEMPPLEHGLLEGALAFRQHAAGHTIGPNWPFFISWAERFLAPGAQTARAE